MSRASRLRHKLVEALSRLELPERMEQFSWLLLELQDDWTDNPERQFLKDLWWQVYEFRRPLPTPQGESPEDHL